MDQMPLFGRRCWAVGSSMCRLCEAIPVRTHGWWRPALHGSTSRRSRLPCPISMASRPVKLLMREPKPHGASGSGPRNLGRSGRGSQCPPVWWMPCMPSKLLWNDRSLRGWSNWCGMGKAGLKCRWFNLMPLKEPWVSPIREPCLLLARRWHGGPNQKHRLGWRSSLLTNANVPIRVCPIRSTGS